MATIPSDVYILRNVQHLSFAAFVNDNNEENAVSETAPIGAEPAEDIGHKWKITAYQNGTYEIYNERHKVSAYTSNDMKTVQSNRNRVSPIWRILHIPGQPGLLIKYLHGDFCWKLPYAGNHTPIDLAATTDAKENMWTLESRTATYPTSITDSKIPSPVLQERDNLFGNAASGSMPIFDFQSNKAPAHKLDVVIIQPTPIIGMVPAFATLSRIAERISHLADKNSLYVDARLGAITYAAVRGEAYSSIFHFAPLDRLSKAEISGFLPRTGDYFTAALRDALNMDWRSDAAKMIIFAPLAEPSGNTDYKDSEYQRNELIRQLKARNILFTVNADENIRDRFMDFSPFFRILKTNALNESVSIPQNHLMGWTFASTFYKNDISTLLEAFGLKPKASATYNVPPKPQPSARPMHPMNAPDSEANIFYSRRNVVQANIAEESDYYHAYDSTGFDSSESRFKGTSPDHQGGKTRFDGGYSTTDLPPRNPPNVRSAPTSPFAHPTKNFDDLFANMKPFSTFEHSKGFSDGLGDEAFTFRETFVQSSGDRRHNDDSKGSFQSHDQGFARPSTATGCPDDSGFRSPFLSSHPSAFPDLRKRPSSPPWIGSGFPSAMSSTMSPSSSIFESSWKSGGAEFNSSFTQSSSGARRGWNTTFRDGYMSG